MSAPTAGLPRLCPLCRSLDAGLVDLPASTDSRRCSLLICAHCQLPVSLKDDAGADIFESFAERIAEQFRDSPFAQQAVSSFTLCLGLPPLLVLTEWIFQAAPSLDLKKAWRTKLADCFGRLSHLVEDRGSAFQVLLNFASDAAVLEKAMEQILDDPSGQPVSPPRPGLRRSRTGLLKSRGALQTFLSTLPRPSAALQASLALLLSHSSPLSIESIHFAHAPVYVAGRYIKNSRQWSQSPWLGNRGASAEQGDAAEDMDAESMAQGSSVTEGSISELIGRVLEARFGSPCARFSSAGREDLDVRMLGPRGRPFLYEITQPTRLLQSVDNEGELLESWCQEVAHTSGHAVVAHSLARVDGQIARKALLAGESTKSKTYRLLAYSEQGAFLAQRVDALAQAAALFPLALAQRTPIRCLQRRANLVREKWIHRLAAERLSDQWLCVTLQASAGTYIKEFVHSDFGRTTPCLASVLGLCPLAARLELYQLDVLDVDMEDWPPKDAILKKQ